MKKLTKQEAFDKALNGITAQGQPSMRNAMCVYRKELDSGAVQRCGVGWLIDDKTAEEWDDAMVSFTEAFTAGANRTDYGYVRAQAKERVAKTPLSDLDMVFLDDLQSAHDKAAIDLELREEYEGEVMSGQEFIVQFTMNMWLVAQLHGLEFEA